jgi:hypothetical protein
LSGYDVAAELVRRSIVIEKAGLHTITLVTTFQLGPDAVPLLETRGKGASLVARDTRLATLRVL